MRFGVIHVGRPEMVESVTEALRGRYGREVEVLSAPATPVIATHLGIGAWGVAYMVEDHEVPLSSGPLSTTERHDST